MMTSLVANPVTNNFESDRPRDSRRNRKKKAQSRSQQNGQRWKSEAQQQFYSSKLLQALSQVRLGGDGAPPGGPAVREAADRALAFTAKGKTRWSRAILTNRIKLKFRKQRQRSVAATGSSRSKKPRVSVLRLKGKNLPAVQTKVRVLGRLVPGCRKGPLPVILEEATDYIAALEMQVKTMSALSHLSDPALSLSSSSESPPNHSSRLLKHNIFRSLYTNINLKMM